jgi:hypothetical protein
MAEPEVDLSEFEEIDDLGRARAEVSRLRARVRDAQAQHRDDERAHKALREELDDAMSALALAQATDARRAPRWLTPKKPRKGNRGTPVACFSDFHFGEVVDPAEMNWYNAYNPDIAATRIRRFFEGTIKMSRHYLSGVTYDGIVLASLGDTISGDIHDEFRETNELSNYEAVPEVVPLIEAGIAMLLEEFGQVHYVSCPGNHPRDSRKPRYKKRSAHNADTMISRLLARRFDGVKGVTFDIPSAFSVDFQVYNTRFRAEHGDEAKGGGGIQGAMLPLALRTHRVRKQAQAEGSPFDVLLMGHWHQYMSLVSKGFVVNGAGKGYDEYARGKAFDPEPPQQALLLVTPEHGIGIQTPIFVGKRDGEGW